MSLPAKRAQIGGGLWRGRLRRSPFPRVMSAMMVVVSSEIEQFILQICTRPEEHVIQIFASQRADEPFHEGMRQGNVGDGLDFSHIQRTMSLSIGRLKAKVICSAIRGQPQRGFRCFTSTTARMSSALGPFGPGL